MAIVVIFNTHLITGSTLYGQVKLIGRTQVEVKDSEAAKSTTKNIKNTKSKANDSIHQKRKDEKSYDSKISENFITEPGLSVPLAIIACSFTDTI